jgi:phosphate transport system substrate-binding protein
MACAGVVAFSVAGAATAPSAFAASSLSEQGSSLVYPLVQVWKSAYNGTNPAVPVGTTGSGGSGAGITAMQYDQVDIGASDAPLTTSQYAGIHGGSGAVQIPWALSATGIGYHIPGVKTLKLNGKTLAGIFAGKITSWSSSAITKLNPAYKKALKSAGKITPVYRSDGSGDSYAFQHYLTVAGGSAWSYGFSTSWGASAGIGAKGNQGVAADVLATKGTIGYISAYYLDNQNIQTVLVENAAGRFESPKNNASIANAAASNSKFPSQGAGFGATPSPAGLSIVDPSKKYKDAYPISTYTYALINKADANTAGLKAFMSWAVTTGQHDTGRIPGFVPLPSKVAAGDRSIINTL